MFKKNKKQRGDCMRVLKKLPVVMIFLFLFILNSYICLASEYIYVQDEANMLSEDIESLILNSQQEMKEKSGEIYL